MIIKTIGKRIFYLIMIFGLMFLGWAANEMYEDYNYRAEFSGHYFGNWNRTGVDDYNDKVDWRGDWVCVNIRGMMPERALEVCRHEIGHEMFAEYCEQSNNNFNKCVELIK